MANGAHRGRFVYLPFDGESHPLIGGSPYPRLAITSAGLTRTVIVKTCGSVDGAEPDYAWRDNYVITDDDYLAYLNGDPVETLVPDGILRLLRTSPTLFLAHDRREPSLRGLVNRIWRGEPLKEA
jgi:hypothetical protein